MSISKYLSKESTLSFVTKLSESGASFHYDQEKHRLVIVSEQDEFFLRLPITFPPPQGNTINIASVSYVILLIQAGNCALGYFEDGVNLNHKVFRSYMVRKKQGKSQIKYLKTKGKSRAGSRVRLGETVEFFENINERLQTYFEEHEVDRIAISCSKTLIPYLYNSKVETPFTKNDARLYKIPKHIHTPIYDVMMEANKFLLKGELVYEPEQQHFIDTFLKAENEWFDTDEEEDWE
jgi:hypothetical protein